MHDTLVILMHSFNSLLWNLAPASLIMVRLKPHLLRQRQSSVHTGCLALSVANVHNTVVFTRSFGRTSIHFSQQSKHLSESFGSVFKGEKECTVP